MIRVLVYADRTRCLEFARDGIEEHTEAQDGVPVHVVKQRLQVRNGGSFGKSGL